MGAVGCGGDASARGVISVDAVASEPAMAGVAGFADDADVAGSAGAAADGWDDAVFAARAPGCAEAAAGVAR